MDCAARDVMREYSDVVLAYGQSDEYSFLLRRSTKLYNRRHSKILSTLVSHFTASYIFNWAQYFPTSQLTYPPTFDGRIILYPTEKEIRDYFAWRQVDTHTNNLYNTTFHALIQHANHTSKSAHETLRGTASSAKHEILFSRFGINYNELPLRFRKGSVLVRERVKLDDSNDTHADVAVTLLTKSGKIKDQWNTVVLHTDIIKDGFWTSHPDILNV